jgi:hypothetical protein
MRLFLNILVGLITMASVAGAREGENQTFSVPLSSPGSPAILEVELMEGSIKVTGYEGNEVLIDVTFVPDEEDDEGDGEREGLMRIPSVSGGLTIEEDQNRVSIETDWSPNEIYVDIRTPLQTSLRLEGVNGDLIEAHGVSGQHEISHTNGDIIATGLRGSVVADSTNGDIKIELLEVASGVPMSFTTFNGDIDLSLPTSVEAELRMQSSQGDIYTDFDVVTRPTQARVDREERSDGYRVRIEREVLGSIGSGGPELRFKTINGDIYLRKLP